MAQNFQINTEYWTAKSCNPAIKTIYVMAKLAQDCLHIQAAYRNTLLHWSN